MPITFDRGPTEKQAKHLAAVPPMTAWQADLWLSWGPVFHRGRLDGKAKVILVASDPGPTERLAARTLVGDAGQRVQGFLDKLGLNRSYVCLNACPYAIHPSSPNHKAIVDDPALLAWRNTLFGTVVGPATRAVVAFGANAKRAVAAWSSKPASLSVFNVRHPSAPGDAQTLAEWAPAVTSLRALLGPDPGGTNTGPNYGTAFQPSDWKPIPRADLPFGVPAWLGDDAANRARTPPQFNCCWRDPTDLKHKLVWQAPG